MANQPVIKDFVFWGLMFGARPVYACLRCGAIVAGDLRSIHRHPKRTYVDGDDEELYLGPLDPFGHEEDWGQDG